METVHHCMDHTGCLRDIENLQLITTGHRQEINTMKERFDDKVDKIMTRLNIALTGLTISAILLALNLVVR